MFAGKKSAQIREILISESAWEEMTCLFAPSLAQDVNRQLSIMINAFDKDNAQEIIVAAAGEIQSLVQNYCSNRSD